MTEVFKIRFQNPFKNPAKPPVISDRDQLQEWAIRLILIVGAFFLSACGVIHGIQIQIKLPSPSKVCP